MLPEVLFWGRTGCGRLTVVLGTTFSELKKKKNLLWEIKCGLWKEIACIRFCEWQGKFFDFLEAQFSNLELVTVIVYKVGMKMQCIDLYEALKKVIGM
jgi:hypothetical protein